MLEKLSIEAKPSHMGKCIAVNATTREFAKLVLSRRLVPVWYSSLEREYKVMLLTERNYAPTIPPTNEIIAPYSG